MLKFEVNSGKCLLKTTIGMLVSASMLVGCSSTSNTATQPQTTQQPTQNQDGYCYKGGKAHDYSCDPEKASIQADLRSPEIDDEWMKNKLAEVKSWIAKEKQAIQDARTQERSITVNQTTHSGSTTSYLTTVSNATPIPETTTPEIEQSLRFSQQGQHNKALSTINALLTQRPEMAAAHLTKGIILSNMGNKADAKRIFTELMKAYPDRPEAFNNLAVIYSEEGNYSAAIETLQQAFQTHPSYARVHSNLKELYATLASQAYNKALDLGSASSGPELAMINESPAQYLNGGTATIAAASLPVQQPTPSQQQDVEMSHPAPMPSTEEQTASPVPVVLESEGTETAQQPDNVETASAASPEEISTPAVESTSTVASNPEQEIYQHLTNWSTAWSAQDHQGYIASYTDEFRPNAKLTHQQWTDQRRQRLTKPKYIKVTLNNIQIKLLRSNLAEAKFDQRYQSDTYKDAVKKRVMLVNTPEGWKISLERSLGLIN